MVELAIALTSSSNARIMRSIPAFKKFVKKVSYLKVSYLLLTNADYASVHREVSQQESVDFADSIVQVF